MTKKLAFSYLSLGGLLAAVVLSTPLGRDCMADTPATPSRAETSNGSLLLPNGSLLLPDVSKMSDEEAKAAMDQFGERVYALRQSVLAQLKQPKLGSEKKAGLYGLAAGLHVYEAMDIMINDIGFINQPNPLSTPGAPMPMGVSGLVVQDLLPNFGLPAFGEIMEVMSDRKADVPFVAANTDAYARVLWAIEGKRCALIRLQERLPKEKDPKVRSQYLGVIKWLNRIPDGHGY